MSDFARVRVGEAEFTTGREYAEHRGWQVLDEPTHLPDGRLRPQTRLNGRPEKPRTTVNEAAAKKKGAVIESAPTQEGND